LDNLSCLPIGLEFTRNLADHSCNCY